MPLGPPVKYTEDMPARLIELMKDGKSKAQVCADFGISRETFYEWIKVDGPYYKPLLSDALKKGEQFCQAWWEQKGLESLENPKLNTGLFCFMMKNRFKADYGEKNVVELGDSLLKGLPGVKIEFINGEQPSSDTAS